MLDFRANVEPVARRIESMGIERDEGGQSIKGCG